MTAPSLGESPLDQAITQKVIQFNIQEKVFSEQITIQHHILLTSVPANFICAFIIFIGFYNSESSGMIIKWFAGIFLISLLRMLTYFFYSYKPQNTHLHLAIFIVCLILSASLWGMLDSVLMPASNHLEQMMIIVVIAGVTA